MSNDNRQQPRHQDDAPTMSAPLSELADAVDAVGVVKPRRFCIGCGYPLDGLDGRTCPECGRLYYTHRGLAYTQQPPRERWLAWMWRGVFAVMIVGLLLVAIVVDIIAAVVLFAPVAIMIVLMSMALGSHWTTVRRRGGRREISTIPVPRRPF